MELDCQCQAIKAMKFRSQGNEKMGFSPTRPADAQDFGSENKVTTEYEYIFSLALLKVKLWLKKHSSLHELCTLK